MVKDCSCSLASTNVMVHCDSCSMRVKVTGSILATRMATELLVPVVVAAVPNEPNTSVLNPSGVSVRSLPAMNGMEAEWAVGGSVGGRGGVSWTVSSVDGEVAVVVARMCSLSAGGNATGAGETKSSPTLTFFAPARAGVKFLLDVMPRSLSKSATSKPDNRVDLGGRWVLSLSAINMERGSKVASSFSRLCLRSDIERGVKSRRW